VSIEVAGHPPRSFHRQCLLLPHARSRLPTEDADRLREAIRIDVIDELRDILGAPRIVGAVGVCSDIAHDEWVSPVPDALDVTVQFKPGGK